MLGDIIKDLRTKYLDDEGIIEGIIQDGGDYKGRL